MLNYNYTAHRIDLPQAVTVFAATFTARSVAGYNEVFSHLGNGSLVGVYAGDSCIVAVTTDGRRHGWGQSFELWPVVTIKEGTKPRGCAVPKE